MKSIYVVLVKAHTGLGSIARNLTGYEYTHIAVCMNRKLDDFITYSRRRHFLPFDAGFMHEKRDFYAFGKYRSTKIKVFRIPAGNSEYRQITDFISSCENDSSQMFNLFSMATMPLLHGFMIPGTHNCMTFVSNIIRLSGCVKMKRHFCRYSIKELDELLTDYFVFEGNLRRTDSPEYEKYMEKPSAGEYISYGAGTVITLTKRMISGKYESGEK